MNNLSRPMREVARRWKRSPERAQILRTLNRVLRRQPLQMGGWTSKEKT